MSKKLTKNPYSQSGIDHIFPVSGAWRDSSNGGERFRRILFGFAVVGDLHVGRIFGGWRTRRAHSRRRQRQRRDVRGRQADAERTSLEEISWPPGGQSKTWSRRCRWQDPGLRSKDPQKCVRDDPQRLQLVQAYCHHRIETFTRTAAWQMIKENNFTLKLILYFLNIL